jgi:hypothetical protein
MHVLSSVEPVSCKSLPMQSVCAVNRSTRIRSRKPSRSNPVSFNPYRSVRCCEIPADLIGRVVIPADPIQFVVL